MMDMPVRVTLIMVVVLLNFFLNGQGFFLSFNCDLEVLRAHLGLSSRASRHSPAARSRIPEAQHA